MQEQLLQVRGWGAAAVVRGGRTARAPACLTCQQYLEYDVHILFL